MTQASTPPNPDLPGTMTVTREENSLTRSVFGALRRADHDDVSKASRNRLPAPEDECPQRDLAELHVGLRKIEPLFAVELDDLT
jgi:hypothetical protein